MAVHQKDQDLLNTIASNITRYRTGLKLSKERLAVLANIEARSIYNYESAKIDITVSSLSKLAKALNVEPYQLLMKVGDQH